MQLITRDDFLNYKYIGSLKLSPDKKNAAFVIHQANHEENKYDSNIWVYSRDTNEYNKITSRNEERNLVWLDNETILFPGIRDKAIKNKVNCDENWTVYYAIKINGGEAYEYLRIPLKVNDIERISANIFLLNATYEHNNINVSELKRTERENAIKEIKENKDYEVLDEIPFWNNFTGYTNKKRNRLYIFDSKKQEIKPITDEFTDVILSKIKDDKILYTANYFENKKGTTKGLYMYDIKCDEERVLIPEGRYRIDYANFICDKIIIAALDTEEKENCKKS